MKIPLSKIINGLRTGEIYPSLIIPYLKQDYSELMEGLDFRNLDIFLEEEMIKRGLK